MSKWNEAALGIAQIGHLEKVLHRESLVTQPFLHPLRSLWIITHLYGVSPAPSSFTSFAEDHLHLAPLSSSVTRLLNSIRPSTDTWGTPLVTGLHWTDFKQAFEPGISASFQSTSMSIYPLHIASVCL